VTQFTLEHGVQISLDVKSDLFAFSKIGDSCARTQEFLIDPTSASAQTQCLAVHAEAGVRPSFIKSLADMAPKSKTGNSRAHDQVLKGDCVTSADANGATSVPPNWLTTPYVITRTSRMTASFGFVGPTLRLAPADVDGTSASQPVNLEYRAPQITQSSDPKLPFVNLPARNILLETELFPIMRTTIIGVEFFVVPFVSSHVQIKHQPKSEPGPCDATATGQLCAPLTSFYFYFF
jgi:hypothetical protein